MPSVILSTFDRRFLQESVPIKEIGFSAGQITRLNPQSQFDVARCLATIRSFFEDMALGSYLDSLEKETYIYSRRIHSLLIGDPLIKRGKFIPNLYALLSKISSHQTEHSKWPELTFWRKTVHRVRRYIQEEEPQGGSPIGSSPQTQCDRESSEGVPTPMIQGYTTLVQTGAFITAFDVRYVCWWNSYAAETISSGRLTSYPSLVVSRFYSYAIEGWLPLEDHEQVALKSRVELDNWIEREKEVHENLKEISKENNDDLLFSLASERIDRIKLLSRKRNQPEFQVSSNFFEKCSALSSTASLKPTLSSSMLLSEEKPPSPSHKNPLPLSGGDSEKKKGSWSDSKKLGLLGGGILLVGACVYWVVSRPDRVVKGLSKSVSEVVRTLVR